MAFVRDLQCYGYVMSIERVKVRNLCRYFPKKFRFKIVSNHKEKGYKYYFQKLIYEAIQIQKRILYYLCKIKYFNI